MIDIIETVYRGASKGRGLVVSPKGNSSLERLSKVAQPLPVSRLLNQVSILKSARRDHCIPLLYWRIWAIP